MNRVAPSAPNVPRTAPAKTMPRAWRMIIATVAAALAPNAMRTPISLVRLGYGVGHDPVGADDREERCAQRQAAQQGGVEARLRRRLPDQVRDRGALGGYDLGIHIREHVADGARDSGGVEIGLHDDMHLGRCEPAERQEDLGLVLRLQVLVVNVRNDAHDLDVA